MQIDTGADTSLIPAHVVSELGLPPSPSGAIDLVGFDERPATYPVVLAKVRFEGVGLSAPFAVIPARVGILGRNLLNRVPVLLDGPQLRWRRWMAT